jgi:hypothetical protein
MRFPEDLAHQMHTVDGRNLPVVFLDDSMVKYTCHVKGGNVVGGCSGIWSTSQIDKHMIEKHQLCCYNHALSKTKINYRCPFGCRCFFQVDQIAGFITRQQCMVHLERYHHHEPLFQEKLEEVKVMKVQTRLKIKEAFANRKNKIDHYDELESNYRSSRRELDVATIKLNVFQEFINGCPGDVQEQIRDKIQLELAEYLALNTVSQ